MLWGLLISFIISIAAPTSARQGDQPSTVRIGVLGTLQPQRVTVLADEGDLVVMRSGETIPAVTIPRGISVQVSISGENVVVDGPGGAISAPAFRLLPSRGALTVDVVTGKALRSPRIYKGFLDVRPETGRSSRLLLINEVDLESYVASVLSREYGLKDVEGSKAMAIVARTYALKSAGKLGPDIHHSDHISSQVYDGEGVVTPLMRSAAEATQGLVLSYRGELCEATYSSSSGGHTAGNETVWKGRPLPYLRGKADPYDRSPQQNWKWIVSSRKLLDAFSANRKATITGISEGKRGTDGRLHTVTLHHADGTRESMVGNDFRMTVTRYFGAASMKSTLSTFSLIGEDYVFKGSGYGHGVGLSQWGAHEMARQGFNYSDILAFYFPGTSVTPLARAAGAVPVRKTKAPARRRAKPASTGAAW